jgi:poly-gamma-glutamate synthesis protein (capsule biosynthesis protein)
MGKRITVVILLLVIIVCTGITLYSLSHQLSSKTQPINNHTPANNQLPPLPTISIPPLTLTQIFSSNHSWTSRLPQNETITIITTGDVMPGRTVNTKMHEHNDFTHPFTKTADLLRIADFTLINLEAPLIKNCPLVNGGMIFCGDYRFIDGLKFAGIDAANIANNHIFNYGQQGIQETIQVLSNNQIIASGQPLNELSITTIKATKIGLLGYDLLSGMDENLLLKTVSTASKKVDILVVSLHWGIEYTHNPEPRQQDLAYRIINEGADLIVGNHPHWFQPIEIYQGKLIIYAHGNFIFDQEWSEKTKTGYIAKHTFFQHSQVDAEIFPIYISDYNQPELLAGTRKNQVLDILQTISNSKNVL